MNSSLSITDSHLSNGVLLQFMDDELTLAEAAKTERHLAHCSMCSHRYAELRRVSSSLDGFMESLQPAFSLSERQVLASKLESVNARNVSRTAAKAGPRLAWWGLAAAAALTVGVLYLPSSHSTPGAKTTQVARESTSAFE